MSDYPIHILIGTYSKEGLWFYQMQRSTLKGKRTIRNAGRMNTEASKHTLALTALIAALRSVTKAEYADMVDLGKNARPHVSLIVDDASFAEALDITNTSPDAQLKAGANFIEEYQRVQRRFRFTVEYSEDDHRIFSAKRWARIHLPDSSNFDAADLIFTPRAVSQFA
ncbi:MAG TPA: hypothetical protein VGR47_03955 [Terracidiphilus sp.]|nr:hypothetical protein [Terracidiphilus sp.]